MLEIQGLTVSYHGLRALEGVSMHVDAGEFVAVIGANGAGKTTLVKTIIGLLRPDAGSIRLNGQEIIGCSPYELVGRGIATVPEGRRLFAELTVRENLLLGAYLPRMRSDAPRRMEKVFEIFPQLSERLNQFAGLMSGGEQQMLAIGRALMSEPRLLILDEPSLGLSPKLVDEVLAVVASLHTAGRSVLLVEQNVQMALRLADRGYAFSNGRILLEGSDLLERPEVKQAYLGM
jgi:branched-chain amino acid transport system ATP-binding protein